MNIKFNTTKQKQEFEEYLIVRGEGVYQMVYDALNLYSDTDYVNAEDFISLIRYDKRIRDTLYRFLGTAEEYLKNELWRQIEYTGNKLIKNLNKNNINKFQRCEDFGYNFFKYSLIDFGVLIDFLKTFGIGFNEDLLEDIRLLRNKVMHHTFILVNPKENVNKSSIKKNLDEIQLQIKSLYNILPSKWNKSVLYDIKHCNIENNEILSKYIKLEI